MMVVISFERVRHRKKHMAPLKVLEDRILGNLKGGLIRKMIKENPGLKRFEPRSDQDVDLMKMVIRLKFHQHRNLADVLCAFQPDVVFIENTGKRRGASAEFWGARQVNEGIWKGSNWLGILLGELKFELKNAS